MVYVFDIDGTICTDSKGNYETAEPIISRVNKINSLYEDNHTIICATARGMGRNNGDQKKSHDSFYDFTKNQLLGWGVKFHKLYLGKPPADFYIDDKSINMKIFFDE